MKEQKYIDLMKKALANSKRKVVASLSRLSMRRAKDFEGVEVLGGRSDMHCIEGGRFSLLQKLINRDTLKRPRRRAR